MAGIYMHIPFCTKMCTYCDFHFSTSFRLKEEVLAAMHQEIILQKDYLSGAPLETIYFGGGTPSVLNKEELAVFFDLIHQHFPLADDLEITLEANPDNLTKTYIQDLKSLGINRLSIGIQSFIEEHLVWMNRSHNAEQSEYAIKTAQDLGIEDISIDLIFGFPQLSKTQWTSNLEKAVSFDVPHISSYSMMVSPKTALYHQITHHQIPDISEEESAHNFLYGKEFLMNKGYEHYEISSFGKKGYHSRHNSSYWKGIPYLGVGPSAHSYNIKERQWNVRNNKRYIDSMAKGIIPAEVEILTPINRLNELILTQLRMDQGLYIPELEEVFGKELLQKVIRDAETYLKSKRLLLTEDGFLKLSTEGQLYADIIASDLFQY